MIVTIHTAGLQTLAQVRAFVDDNTPIAFTLTDRTPARQWMTQTLRRFHYPHLSRSDKGVLRRFLGKVTGLSRAQVIRVITQFCVEGIVTDRRQGPANPQLENLKDGQILTLQEAAALLGLENPTLESLASRKAYGLKSRMYNTNRSFIVCDLRAFLMVRQQSTI